MGMALVKSMSLETCLKGLRKALYKLLSNPVSNQLKLSTWMNYGGK